MITPPIIARSNGDISVFRTKTDAIHYVEAIDVDNDEYSLVLDSTGGALRFKAELSKRGRLTGEVSLEEQENVDPDPHLAYETIASYLERIGQTRPRDLQEALEVGLQALNPYVGQGWFTRRFMKSTDDVD
jgi:hypothetical protein